MISHVSIFKALGDPIRLRLINLLAQRGPGICVCDLVHVLKLPQSTISRQMTPLKNLGLVKARRAGTWILYGLEGWDESFFRELRECLDIAANSGELAADLLRFDELKKRRELASCCQPALMAANSPERSSCCLD